MARLRFLLFALAVLGLWLGHLPLLSPVLAERAIEQASAHAQLAPAAVHGVLEQRRAELLQAALNCLISNPIVTLMRSGARDEPSVERFAPVRAALTEALPERMKSAAIVGVVFDNGYIYAKGSDAPVPSGDEAAKPVELDLASIAKAGTKGVAQHVFGKRYLFVAVPFASPDAKDKPEGKVQGWVVLGAPALPDGALEQLAKTRGFGALSLAVGGMPAESEGSEKNVLLKAADGLPSDGRPVVIARAHLGALGPIKLPILASRGSGKEGGPASIIAARQALPGTPYEVLSSVSVRPFMQSLAEYQRFALLAFVGLLGLTVVWSVLLREGAPEPARAKTLSGSIPRVSDPGRANSSPPPVPMGGAAARPSVEASKEEDFPFGLPPPPARSNGHANGSQGTPPDLEATMAYSAPAAAELFGSAKPQGSGPHLGGDQDYNPDETRVAAIPHELIQASARNEDGAGNSAASRSPEPGTDDHHFREVFRDFVSTRERCGEVADGLTFDKFALKLRKNRDQLVQKYNCRTVRFQVYVKEGRAALKATPIKE